MDELKLAGLKTLANSSLMFVIALGFYGCADLLQQPKTPNELAVADAEKALVAEQAKALNIQNSTVSGISYLICGDHSFSYIQFNVDQGPVDKACEAKPCLCQIIRKEIGTSLESVHFSRLDFAYCEAVLSNLVNTDSTCTKYNGVEKQQTWYGGGAFGFGEALPPTEAKKVISLQ